MLLYMRKEMNDKLILGTVQFGCQYGINSAGRPDGCVVREILNEAEALGITTLDTSSAYGDAEKILGNAIQRKGSFKIISKYPQCHIPVEECFYTTLSHIGIDRLYGYLVHHFDVYKNNPGIWRDFEKLKQDGKTDRIGFSLYHPAELELLLKNKTAFNIVQIPYNILDRKFEPYLRVLHDMDVEIHVRSTFLQGLFFMDREKLPIKLLPLKKYLLQLDEYAKRNRMSMSSLALNYNIQNPYIDGVLIGVDNGGQLQMNVHSVTKQKIDIDIRVSEEELLNPVNWK